MNIQKYKEYANSPEAFAVLFVRKYLKSADSSVWISVLSYDAYNYRALRFKSVECELVPRRTRPDYPPRGAFWDEDEHIMACRAATWEAANHDITRWEAKGRQGRQYLIQGVSWPLYERSGSRLVTSPDPEKYFRPDAPEEIKALAKNLNDRTDPLWDKAMQYISQEYGGPRELGRLGGPEDDEEYGFRIKSVKRIV